MQKNAAGEAGVCTFPDGSSCDEWAYFRNECQPGDSKKAASSTVATLQPSIEVGEWKTYRNDELGYTFAYPTDASVTTGDDPLKSLHVGGKDGWPSIFISHPTDRAEYQPPEGTDLSTWLKDHNLVSDTRLDDTQIAGTTAIHFRHDRSPQSFANDRYYFAHAGQLFVIVFNHEGDKEDWQVYNHFLESFQFIRKQ